MTTYYVEQTEIDDGEDEVERSDIKNKSNEKNDGNENNDNLQAEDDEKKMSEEEEEDCFIPKNDGRLPSFLADAFEDLYREDGLLVLGRGMGILSLVCAFMRFYADVDDGHLSLVEEEEEEEDQHHSNEGVPNSSSANQTSSPQQIKGKRPPLVFVLGLKDIERKTVMTILQRWGTPTNLLPKVITNEAGQGKDRAIMYKRGGVFIVTSRILIVDLLTHIANPSDIEGILVAHAESVTEQSTEAFILRIFRTQRHWATSQQRNTLSFASPKDPSLEAIVSTLEGPSVTKCGGFVKAFSDDPASLMAGFHKVDKILKALYVGRLYLYPRFHDSVRNELEAHPPEVIELHQNLTDLMRDVQYAIAAAIDTCIKELKQSTPLIDWNSFQDGQKGDYGGGGRNGEGGGGGGGAGHNIRNNENALTLDNCLSKNFDLIISKQLDQDWHRIKPAAKQLVNDLRTLRTLLRYLIEYDAVSFWKLLTNIKSMNTASKFPSMWLLTKAGDRVFQKAKERLYLLEDVAVQRNGDNTNKPSSPDSNSHPKQQKPKRLIPVLEENPKWRLLRSVLTEIRNDWDNNNRTNNTSQRDNTNNFSFFEPRVLVMCKDERTVELLRSYLVDGRERTMTLRWLRYLENVNETARMVTKTGGVSGLSEEARLLIEEESRARHLLFGNHGPTNHSRRAASSDWISRDHTTSFDDASLKSSSSSRNTRQPTNDQESVGSVSSTGDKKSLGTSNAAQSKRNSKKGGGITSPQTTTKRSKSGLTSDYQRKRRKVASEINRGGQLNEDEVTQRDLLDEAIEASEQDLNRAIAMTNVDSSNDNDMMKDDDPDDNNNDDYVKILGVVSSSTSIDEDGNVTVDTLQKELTVMFRTYDDAEGEQAAYLLKDLNPHTIVMYDADSSFIRAIEIHCATMTQTYLEEQQQQQSQHKDTSTTSNDNNEEASPPMPPKLKIYFTLFQESAEEKMFMKNLERERNAFERLIQHKQNMPMTLNTGLTAGMTQELQQTMLDGVGGLGSVAGTYANGTLPLAVDTRTGKGKASSSPSRKNKLRRDIAVDVREFRSALPSVLHQGGMRLAPVTLTVGDFVLSPVHCVERKSISDLFGSFASGRLFTQAEQMAKHYKCPCLLIEFDPSKSFCLQSVNQLGSDIKTDSVCSKLCLLTMHVPTLRILWSKDQHQTLKIFMALKKNHDEVNVEKAIEIGSSESLDDMLGGDGDNSNDNTSNEINEMARDLLLRLPGVNINNARKIMSSCDTLAELAEMSRDQLRELIGPISGQKLFSFLRQRIEL